MTEQERSERIERVRKMKEDGLSTPEIAQREGIDVATARYMLGGRKVDHLNRLGVKNLSVAIDLETADQLDALAAYWSLSRGEVIRIMIDWGMEALPSVEKEICEKAASACSHGEV